MISAQFCRHVVCLLVAGTLFRDHTVGWVKPGTLEFLTTSRAFAITLVVSAMGAIAIALDLQLAGASQLLVAAWMVLAQVTVLLLMVPRGIFVTRVVSILSCAIPAPAAWVSIDPRALFRPPQH